MPRRGAGGRGQPRKYPPRKLHLTGERFTLKKLAVVSLCCHVAGVSTMAALQQLTGQGQGLHSLAVPTFLGLAAVALALEDLPRHQPSNQSYRHLPVRGIEDFHVDDFRHKFRFRKPEVYELLYLFGLLNENGQPKKLKIYSTKSPSSSWWIVMSDTALLVLLMHLGVQSRLQVGVVNVATPTMPCCGHTLSTLHCPPLSDPPDLASTRRTSSRNSISKFLSSLPPSTTCCATSTLVGATVSSPS